MQDKNVLLFDLDGTLVDSAPDLALAVNRTFRDLNKKEIDEETIRGWVGNGATVLVERALSGSFTVDSELDRAEVDQALALFFEHYSKCLSESSTLYADVKTGLFALKAAGYRLGIVTNKPEQFIQPMLVGQGIDGLFDVIVGGDTLAEKKPHPAPLHFALKQLGASLEASVMIGDSKNDIIAAKAANIDSVGLTYGYNYGEDINIHQPNWCFDTFGELLTVLKK